MILVISELCRNGDIRLSSSNVSGYGEIQVCVHNSWNSICYSTFDRNDASVICQQLGFSRYGRCKFIFLFFWNVNIIYIFAIVRNKP